jgi:hypothetical protein
MDTDNVKYHPMNVRTLEKGQTITVPELERILHVSIDHHSWWAKVLGLKQWIVTERSKLELPYITISQKGFHGGLHVCTDAEAADYNTRRGKHGRRTIFKALKGKLAVDVNQLTAAERQVHEVSLKRLAFYARGLRKHAPQELAAPPERTTPPMLVKE